MKNPLFSVEHVGMPANDPVTLHAWYLRVLGARLIFQSDQTPPTFYVELPGGLILEIGKAQSSVKETGDNTVAGFRHLALRVESIEAAHDILLAKGVKFSDPIKPAGGGGRVLFFADPEGNVLHLLERPADSLFKP